jgi:hypothetical protein
VDDKGGRPLSARPPTRQDLARIARALNEAGAKYAVIGGFAMLHHGFARATMDIDLLVDPAPDNVELVRQALSILEDRAALEVKTTDVAQYNVVRIADEIVIDLLAKACSVALADVANEIEIGDVEGVAVPYLSPKALLLTKETVSDKDRLDRLYLERLLSEPE